MEKIFYFIKHEIDVILFILLQNLFDFVKILKNRSNLSAKIRTENILATMRTDGMYASNLVYWCCWTITTTA